MRDSERVDVVDVVLGDDFGENDFSLYWVELQVGLCCVSFRRVRRRLSKSITNITKKSVARRRRESLEEKAKPKKRRKVIEEATKKTSTSVYSHKMPNTENF